MTTLDTILVNGKVVREADLPKAFGNRGFTLGDGVFESMRYTSGHVPFLGLHVQRLLAALKAHGIELDANLEEGALRQSIGAWSQIWGAHQDVRIRLTAFRAGGCFHSRTAMGMFDHVRAAGGERG